MDKHFPNMCEAQHKQTHLQNWVVWLLIVEFGELFVYSGYKFCVYIWFADIFSPYTIP